MIDHLSKLQSNTNNSVTLLSKIAAVASLKENNIQGTGIYQEAGKWTRITVGTMKEMQRFISVL